MLFNWINFRELCNKEGNYASRIECMLRLPRYNLISTSSGTDPCSSLQTAARTQCSVGWVSNKEIGVIN